MKIATALIARCPQHGLHGEREECFVCGGAVEQVRMIAADELVDLLEGIKANAEAEHKAGTVRGAPEIYAQGLVDGTAETCRQFLDLLRGRS